MSLFPLSDDLVLQVKLLLSIALVRLEFRGERVVIVDQLSSFLKEHELHLLQLLLFAYFSKFKCFRHLTDLLLELFNLIVLLLNLINAIAVQITVLLDFGLLLIDHGLEVVDF